jgi:hypothetical protein
VKVRGQLLRDYRAQYEQTAAHYPALDEPTHQKAPSKTPVKSPTKLDITIERLNRSTENRDNKRKKTEDGKLDPVMEIQVDCKFVLTSLVITLSPEEDILAFDAIEKLKSPSPNKPTSNNDHKTSTPKALFTSPSPKKKAPVFIIDSDEEELTSNKKQKTTQDEVVSKSPSKASVAKTVTEKQVTTPLTPKVAKVSTFESPRLSELKTPKAPSPSPHTKLINNINKELDSHEKKIKRLESIVDNPGMLYHTFTYICSSNPSCCNGS